MSCSPWGHKESDMAERLNNNNFKLKSVLLCVKSFSCVWLFVSPWTVAHQSPSVHGISQAKILEKFAMSSSRGSSQPRDQTLVSCVSCIARRFFTTVPLGRPRCSFQIRSDQISRSAMSNSSRPHESQHVRPPYPSPTPGVHPNSSPSSQ